ncbi:hypothetical protein D3C87_943340 [compost metagenome]
MALALFTQFDLELRVGAAFQQWVNHVRSDLGFQSFAVGREVETRDLEPEWIVAPGLVVLKVKTVLVALNGKLQLFLVTLPFLHSEAGLARHIGL